MKLLFEQEDVNLDSSSKSGRTPLSWAAENGHEGIVKLLLGREDVNPDTQDTVFACTPHDLSNKIENETTQVKGLEVTCDSTCTEISVAGIGFSLARFVPLRQSMFSK